MRIGLIGDVHANLPALEAVMTHAARQGVENFWNIGDFVGYNAFPEEVVRLLRSEHVISIIGNYDRKVLKAEAKREKWAKTKDPDKLMSFVWTYENLSPESRSFLASLPEQKHLEQEGYSILLVHGSPTSIDEHLQPDTPEERFLELSQIAQADIVICGHSHQPFVIQAGATCFINTGSIGRPDDGDPRACYAILTIETGHFSVEHFRIAYDVDRAVAQIRSCGLPEDFARMIQSGKNLNAIKEEDVET